MANISIISLDKPKPQSILQSNTLGFVHYSWTGQIFWYHRGYQISPWEVGIYSEVV